MRGRTNIPPRLGGIVSGIVRDYQVAEKSGISIGDYVEFVAGNSSHIRGLMTASEYDFGNNIKEEYGAGPFSTRLIELSDGRYCMFYVASSSSDAYAIAQLFEEVDGTFVEERIELTEVKGGYAYSTTNFACEIEEDKILLLFAPYRASYAAGYILEYDGSKFNVTTLTLSSEIGNIYSESGSSERAMYKWSDDLYVIPSTSNKSITIMRLDEASGTATFVSNLVLTSSSYYTLHILGKYSGYLVVQTTSTTISVIEISDDGTATIVSTGTVPESQYNIGSQYIKLNDNTFFYVHGFFDISYTVRYNDFTIYITVIKILSDGSVSISTTASKRYADCLYQYAQAGYNTGKLATMFYQDGVIFGLASGAGSSSSSGDTRYDAMKDLFSLPIEISDDGNVSFGEISVQHLGYRDSSGVSSRSYNQCGRGPIREDGTVCILTKEVLARGKPLYLVKPSKEGLSNLYAADLMKKYSTKISGVAKTAGAYGEIIEVYAPE